MRFWPASQNCPPMSKYANIRFPTGSCQAYINQPLLRTEIGIFLESNAMPTYDARSLRSQVIGSRDVDKINGSLSSLASLSVAKWNKSWWRHQMETLFRVTDHLCGAFTGPGEFPSQRPVTGSFDVFFDLRLNKQLSKQWRGWWFETLSRPLWRHCNDKCILINSSRPIVTPYGDINLGQHWLR